MPDSLERAMKRNKIAIFSKMSLNIFIKFQYIMLSDLLNETVRLIVHPAIKQKLYNNGVFWDVTPCGSCKNRCFGGT
jgi:hypothetical protein